MHRRLLALALGVLALTCGGVCADATDDASAGYESIKPSLVKVWAFDRSGRPSQSGTGVIVDAGDRGALVLTATHVVEGAASIRIDISRDVHDLVAHVERTGPRDLTLLSVAHGGLHAARFAPRTRPVIEGNLVAVAGYVKNDELIGIVGQEPRVLFPGTVSSRPDDGRYLELENVHIEEGLSGGPVFDPETGEVLGIITSRTTDGRGGFADSGASVVLPFLAADRVATAQPSAPPRAVAVAVPFAVAVPPPVRETLPAIAPRPVPLATLAAQVAFTLPAADGIVSWQSAGGDPKRFLVMRAGCRIAVTIDVQTLQFVVAHQTLVTPHHRGELLSVAVQQRAGEGAGCEDVADVEPTDGSYEPTAMSFNGKHVTMRFVYGGDRANAQLFPGDASLDADLDGATVTATLQFFGRDWNGSIALPLEATPLAAVSSTW